MTARLWPLLVAVYRALTAGVAVSATIHSAHGWSPAADRHLDHQLVRREAMERLKPWGASPDDLADELTDPLTVRQLELINASTANLGLPMSGLLLRTPTDVLRVWRSDDGSLPDAATDGLRAFYRQAPSRQLQLTLDDDPTGARRARGHLALLWADAGAALTRFDLVRPGGHICRRILVDWHIDLLDRVNRTAALPTYGASSGRTAGVRRLQVLKAARIALDDRGVPADSARDRQRRRSSAWRRTCRVNQGFSWLVSRLDQPIRR